MSKYHSQKTTIGGETFDSLREYRRWCELRLLERAGVITDLRRQERFLLLPSQKYKDETVERPVHYIADFTYFEKQTGEFVVEDAKGMRTKEYILKRKMMLYHHGIRIREV